MLWGILLHSGVLRAEDIGDTFHKMIRVGDRRLNITLLMSLQAHLPCWYEEVMPRLDFRAPMGLTQGH